jgi:lipoic acid synthetase
MPHSERKRKPDWLKVRFPTGANVDRIRSQLRRLGLHTVCEESLCPNMGECWRGGTATFMLMGELCTRGCRFCAVKSAARPAPLDPEEPEKVGRTVASLGLRYVVLTSVDRDDLPDGGADHFARTVEALKREQPDLLVEILVPDFQGDPAAIDRVAGCGADVLAHNVETVERLTPRVRDPRATYEQSLRVLEELKGRSGGTLTKSSLMLGLGERDEEVEAAFRDLRSAGCDILTLGQYLQPGRRHLEVVTYLHPESFDEWRRRAERHGFLHVAAGPLVRSSYRAGEFFVQALLRGTGTGGEGEDDGRAASPARG